MKSDTFQRSRLKETLKHAARRAVKLDAIHGFIYIVRCNEFVKIGIATNMERRFYGLQTANPYKLELLRFWPSESVLKDEKLLHAMFDQFRVRLEWFKIPESLLKTILAMSVSDIQSLPIIVPQDKRKF